MSKKPKNLTGKLKEEKEKLAGASILKKGHDLNYVIKAAERIEEAYDKVLNEETDNPFEEQVKGNPYRRAKTKLESFVKEIEEDPSQLLVKTKEGEQINPEFNEQIENGKTKEYLEAAKTYVEAAQYLEKQK